MTTRIATEEERQAYLDLYDTVLVSAEEFCRNNDVSAPLMFTVFCDLAFKCSKVAKLSKEEFLLYMRDFVNAKMGVGVDKAQEN